MAGIFKSDGTTEVRVLTGNDADDTQYSMALLRDGMVGFGDAVNQNFVRIVENFAHDLPPNLPTHGQTWFDTDEGGFNSNTSGRLKINVGPAGSVNWKKLLQEDDVSETKENGTIVQRTDSGSIAVGNVSAEAITATSLNTGTGAITTTGNISGNIITGSSVVSNGNLTVDGHITSSDNEILIGDNSNDTVKIRGDTTVEGNFTFTGTIDRRNVTNTEVTDQIWTLNAGASSGADSSLNVNRGGDGSNDAKLLWDESEDHWKAGFGLSLHEILTTNSALAGGKLTNLTVTEAKIANDAITRSKIADDQIRAEHINNAAVEEGAIKSNAVTTSKIKDANVTNAKIANNSVDNNKLSNTDSYTMAALNAYASIKTPRINIDYTDGIAFNGQQSLNGNGYATRMKINARGRILIGKTSAELFTPTETLGNYEGSTEVSDYTNGIEIWPYSYSKVRSSDGNNKFVNVTTDPEMVIKGTRSAFHIQTGDFGVNSPGRPVRSNILSAYAFAENRADLYRAGILSVYTRYGTGLNTYASEGGIRYNDDGTDLVFEGDTVLSSDKRLKKNIKNLANSVDIVKQLRPVNFKWKNPDKSNNTKQGFIAQEVVEILPELVVSPADENDYYRLNYAGFTPLLTAVTKELIDKIETLESEVAALKAASAPN